MPHFPFRLRRSLHFAHASATQHRKLSGAEAFTLPPFEPSDNPKPLAEDREKADLTQTLRRLGTTASMLMITAHPDDEDGGLLTYPRAAWGRVLCC